MAEYANEYDRIWINARLATMMAGTPYGAIENAALAVKDGRIAYAAPMKALARPPQDLADVVIDAGNRWITPGLIDCHTHIVFGGNRAAEFETRLRGADYAELAAAGGGILSSVTATRAASEDELVETAQRRVLDLMSDGVTTLEIKSGYGLDSENEIKMLRAARRLGSELPVRVTTTFLGAHALPPEFIDKSGEYIDHICDEMLPLVAKSNLADAVDAYCEGIGFSCDETRRVFTAAKAHGLPVKLHADQLSDTGGAALAAEFGALSADHLEYTSDAGVEAMAKAGTVAVLLPSAFYTLGEAQLPPIERLRAAGVPMAVASDANPGTAPARSLRLQLNMACSLFGLTPEEALTGVTRHAAAALGMGDDIGTLEVGKAADFAVWDIDDPAELSYWIGGNLCQSRVFGGIIDART